MTMATEDREAVDVAVVAVAGAVLYADAGLSRGRGHIDEHPVAESVGAGVAVNQVEVVEHGVSEKKTGQGKSPPAGR